VSISAYIAAGNFSVCYTFTLRVVRVFVFCVQIAYVAYERKRKWKRKKSIILISRMIFIILRKQNEYGENFKGVDTSIKNLDASRGILINVKIFFIKYFLQLNFLDAFYSLNIFITRNKIISKNFQCIQLPKSCSLHISSQFILVLSQSNLVTKLHALWITRCIKHR